MKHLSVVVNDLVGRKSRAISLALVFILPLQIFAESFVSFVPKQSLDPNLNKAYQSLVVHKPAQAQITRIELLNYALFFDHRIAAMLNYHVTNHVVQTFPDFLSCRLDEPVAQFQQPQHAAIAALVERITNICYRLRQPESFFNKGSVFKPDFLGSNMSKLEHVIETVVTPTQLQNTQFSFFDEQTTRSVQSAMLRVKMPILERDYKDLFDRIQNVLNATNVSARDKQIAQEIKQHADGLQSVIAQWNQQGLNAFQADQARVASSGKSRGSLPYVNMPDIERKNLTMYLYAMMWRLRGGGFVPLDGTQKARRYFAQIPFTLLAQLNGLDSGTSETLGSNMFMVLALKGWGKWMDMGPRFPFPVESSHLVSLSRRGLEQTDSNEKVMRSIGYDSNIMKFYSAQFGSCYVFSFNSLDGVYLKQSLPKPFSGFFDWPSAWGEHCAGAVFGLGIAETLLIGK
jgi:hypothetical protein